MSLTFTFQPTFRDLQGRFAKAEKAMLETQRDEIRGLARDYVEFLQAEAPQRTGKFVGGIGYRTFAGGGTAGFTVHMPEPLGTFIRKGTRAHAIYPRSKKALYWPGARHPVMSVRHPGTAANRFNTRAYRRWQPGARKALNRISLRYVQSLSG